MTPVEMTLHLHQTFRAYVKAENAATRAYIGYQTGTVSEAEVHRAQSAERAAADAHIEAICTVAGPIYSPGPGSPS